MNCALATDFNGQPYASLVAYAITPDLKKVIFTAPKKSLKYRNILRNKKVVILIDNRKYSNTDYLEAETVTIPGCARPVRKAENRDRMSEVLI